MLSPLLAYGFDGYVASSGGYVVCGEKVIYDCPMTARQQEQALSVLSRNGVFRTVECRDASYADDELKDFLARYAEASGNSELLRWRKQLEQDLGIRSMREFPGDPVYKIVLMFERSEQLQEPRAVLSGEFSFVIQSTDGSGLINGELVNRAFDKGRAVERVCEELGIPVMDSVGFGDSNNDREMLETCGYSVCMANGSLEMKQIADEVCPSVQEDGLAKCFAAHGWS